MDSHNSYFGTRFLSAIFLSSAVFLSPFAIAATGDGVAEYVDDQTEAAARIFDKDNFFVMPIPMSNPTIGTGLGLATMYLFQAGENAPPSSVSLMGFYADSESWAGALGTETFFKDDKYRLSGWVGYYDVNLEFFGIGGEAGDRGESIGINQRGPFLMGRFLFRIANHLYLGPQYRYIANETALQNPILPPDRPGDLIPTLLKDVTSGLGAVLEYDTRDNRFYPLEGSHLEVSANLAREQIGSDDDYEQYEIGYNFYKPLGEHKILAWRTTGCFIGGDAPYWDVCQFGTETDGMRGYVGGQYRDDVSITTQLEFRWRFYKKWGMVAFAGAGNVASTVGDLSFDDLLPSVGVGLRFLASEKDGVNLSIDYARGRDSSDAWYFRIGEAF